MSAKAAKTQFLYWSKDNNASRAKWWIRSEPSANKVLNNIAIDRVKVVSRNSISWENMSSSTALLEVVKRGITDENNRIKLNRLSIAGVFSNGNISKLSSFFLSIPTTWQLRTPSEAREGTKVLSSWLMKTVSKSVELITAAKILKIRESNGTTTSGCNFKTKETPENTPLWRWFPCASENDPNIRWEIRSLWEEITSWKLVCIKSIIYHFDKSSQHFRMFSLTWNTPFKKTLTNNWLTQSLSVSNWRK